MEEKLGGHGNPKKSVVFRRKRWSLKIFQRWKDDTRVSWGARRHGCITLYHPNLRSWKIQDWNVVEFAMTCPFWSTQSWWRSRQSCSGLHYNVMYVSESIHIDSQILADSATFASEYVQSVPLCTVEQSKVRHQHRLKILNKTSVAGELPKFGHLLNFQPLHWV